MNLNADFDQPVVIHTESLDWVDSPMPGVQRRMLDRLGGEVARATSIVRYAPGSRFSAHVHGGGEEFFVLEGVFQDEHGDYPQGSYIRNPPTSSHTPGSELGCTIFVKLWQFDPADRCSVIAHQQNLPRVADSTRPGIEVSGLYKDEVEEVRYEYWAPGVKAEISSSGGAEVFVLSGTMHSQQGPLKRGAWARFPSAPESIKLEAGVDGAQIWLKTGALRYLSDPSLR